MSGFKNAGIDGTALRAPWSEQDYLRWQREQEERDALLRDAMNVRVLARFDPECEAAIRALEEGGWDSAAGIDRDDGPARL